MISEANVQYPFHFKKAFFIKIVLERTPIAPNEEDLEFKAETKCQLNSFEQEHRTLQINLRMSTVKDKPFNFSLEMVGLFEVDRGIDDPNQDLVVDFVNNRGLPLLWPQFLPAMSSLTALMNIKEMSLPIPDVFLLTKEDLFPQKVKSSK